MPMWIFIQLPHTTCSALILISLPPFLRYHELAAGPLTLLSSSTITASFAPALTILVLPIPNIGSLWKKDKRLPADWTFVRQNCADFFTGKEYAYPNSLLY